MDDCLLTPLTLIGPINPSHHQTGFAHGMYRWPMDLIVTLSFLDWSPHCFSDESFFFQLTDLPLWYAAVAPSYPIHPNVGWPVPSHCAMWSVSHCCHFAMNDPCSQSFSLTSLVYLIACNFLYRTEKFSQSLDLVKHLSLICLVHSSHIILSPCLAC